MPPNYPHHQGNMDASSLRNAAEVHHQMSGLPDASSGSNANFNATYDAHMSMSTHAGIEVRTQATTGRQAGEMSGVMPGWSSNAPGAHHRTSHPSLGVQMNPSAMAQGGYVQGYPLKGHVSPTQTHFAGGPSSSGVAANSGGAGESSANSGPSASQAATTHRTSSFSGAPTSSASAPSPSSQPSHSTQSNSNPSSNPASYPSSSDAYFWQQQQYQQQQLLQQQQQQQAQQHHAQHMSLQYQQQQHAQHMATSAQNPASQNMGGYPVDPSAYHNANMNYPHQYGRNMPMHPNSYPGSQMGSNNPMYGNGQQFPPPGYYPPPSGQSMPGYPSSSSTGAMQSMYQGSQSQGGPHAGQQIPSQLSQYSANSPHGSAHMSSVNPSNSATAGNAMRSQQHHPQFQGQPNASNPTSMPPHYPNAPSNMAHNVSSYGYQHAAAAAQMAAARGSNGMMGMHPNAPAAVGHNMFNAAGTYGSTGGAMGMMPGYPGTPRDQQLHAQAQAQAQAQAHHQAQQHQLQQQHQQQQYAAAMAANAAANAAAHAAASGAYGVSSHPNAMGRPGVPPMAMSNPHEDDDDDGEVINSKALAKAESAQNRSKKKRKREGDDDDDEDFTAAEDVDWQPESRRSNSASSKRSKRRASSEWDEPYIAGSTDHLGRGGSSGAGEVDNSDSLVSTRPRRERRTSFKFREGYDFGDDDDVFEDDEAPPRGKSRAKRKTSGSTPAGQASTASTSAASSNQPSSWQGAQNPQQQGIQFYQQDPANMSLSSSSTTQLGGQPSVSSSFSSLDSSGVRSANLAASSRSAPPPPAPVGINTPANRSHTEEDESSELYGANDGEEDAAYDDVEEDTDDGPMIDKVLDYREYVAEDATKNSNSVNADGSKNETRATLRGEMTAQTKASKQYRIKWKGSSYMHCTWEPYDALVGVRGSKKVENYIKAAIKEYQWRKTASREELELHDIEQEMLQDLYDEHLKVDRVIAYRKAEPTEENPKPSPEYLCVWSKLPYVEATWERVEDIAPYQRKIDQYLNRSQQQLMPRVFYGSRIHRPSFREVQLLQTTPTEWLKGGMLRDYQLQGINWLVFSWCNSTNCILADEMGLGKTIQTLSFLGFLQFRQHIPGPFLIVVPLSTIANWEAESAKWLPDMNTVVYIGDSKSRELIREHEFWYRSNGKLMTKFNTLITSYEIILKDKQHLGSIKWNFLAVDEAHRLKNADSALHEVLNDFTTSSRLLITGTPLQNSLKELWALLNFLEPRYFPSLEQFEREYSKLEGEGQLAALHQRLKPHVLRRFKSQVEKSLPAKNERILRVGMAPIQRKYYRWIINRNFAELNRGLRGQEMRTLSNIVVELKKVCNHPFLFPNAEEQARTLAIQQALTPQDSEAPPLSIDSQKLINEAMLDTLIRSSGKLMLLDRLLLRLKETGHRVLIFSQMVRMLDLLSEYLRLRGFQFQRLDGSMSRSARQMAMESFNAEGSKDFCFILSTRAGGLGINLATADTVIIFDSDWNPQNDLQAQSRAHRIGQKHVVNIYRLMVKNTVEEDILERAKRKLVLDHLVIQRMSTGKSAHYNSQVGTGASNQAALGMVGAAGAAAGGQTGSTAGMFSKNELADIIKFGAEDLFKTREDDLFDADGNPIVNGTVKSQLLDKMDIDDILERAEPAPEEVQPGFELLSAFKVASFDTGTEDDDDNKDDHTPSKGRRGRSKSANTKNDPNADFWERVIPAELRIDRVAGSDMIVTGPRARKKRVDISTEESSKDASQSATTPMRPRSTRKAKSAANDAISESALAYAAEGTTDAPLDALENQSSSASVTPNKRSPRLRSSSTSHIPLSSSNSAYDDAYFSGDEEDGEEYSKVGSSVGDSNGAAGDSKKKSRSRKGEKKRVAAGDGEMDASDVRKLLQTVRTYGCDDIAKVIQLAGLSSKWPGIVETTLNDIVAQCRTCIEEATKPNLSSSGSQSAAGSSMDVDSTEPAASKLSSSTEGAAASGKDGEDSKGPKTTIKYLDVSINAVQLLTRLSDLSGLAALVKPYADPYAFRLGVVVKNWTPFASLWSSPVDDAMLLLGAYLYGFGQWNKLSTDEKLGLQNKIFGAGQPTSAQLNTRAESLLKSLRDANRSGSGSTNPMTDIADLEMPTRRKRPSTAKAPAAAATAGSGASSSSSPNPLASSGSKSKTIKRRKTDKDDASSSAAQDPNAAAALAELASFDSELQAQVASIWEPTQAEQRDSYSAMSAMPNSDAKFAAYHRFLVSLRNQVVSLTEYYWAAMNDVNWTKDQLQACLWSHAAVHICGASRTGSVIQLTADHYAKSTPPPLLDTTAQPQPVAQMQLSSSPSLPQANAALTATASPVSVTVDRSSNMATPSPMVPPLSDSSTPAPVNLSLHSESSALFSPSSRILSTPSSSREQQATEQESSEFLSSTSWLGHASSAHQEAGMDQDEQEENDDARRLAASSAGVEEVDHDRDDLGDASMDLDAPQTFDEPDLHNDEEDEANMSHHSGNAVAMDPNSGLADPAEDEDDPSSPSFHEEAGVDDSELETMMNEAVDPHIPVATLHTASTEAAPTVVEPLEGQSVLLSSPSTETSAIEVVEPLPTESAKPSVADAADAPATTRAHHDSPLESAPTSANRDLIPPMEPSAMDVDTAVEAVDPKTQPDLASATAPIGSNLPALPQSDTAPREVLIAPPRDSINMIIPPVGSVPPEMSESSSVIRIDSRVESLDAGDVEESSPSIMDRDTPAVAPTSASSALIEADSETETEVERSPLALEPSSSISTTAELSHGFQSSSSCGPVTAPPPVFDATEVSEILKTESPNADPSSAHLEATNPSFDPSQASLVDPSAHEIGSNTDTIGTESSVLDTSDPKSTSTDPEKSSEPAQLESIAERPSFLQVDVPRKELMPETL